MGLKDRDYLEALTNEVLPNSRELKMTIPEDIISGLKHFGFTEDEILLLNYLRHNYKEVCSLLESLAESGEEDDIYDSLTEYLKSKPELSDDYFTFYVVECRAPLKREFIWTYDYIESNILSKDNISLKNKQLFAYAVITDNESFFKGDHEHISEDRDALIGCFEDLHTRLMERSHRTVFENFSNVYRIYKHRFINPKSARIDIIDIPSNLSYLSAFMVFLGGCRSTDVAAHIQQVRDILYNYTYTKTEEQQLEEWQEYVKTRPKLSTATETLIHLSELENDYKEKFRDAPIDYSLITDLQRIKHNPELNKKNILFSGAAGFILGLILALFFRNKIIEHCPFLWANSTTGIGGIVYYEISKGTQALVTWVIILFSIAVFLGIRFLQEYRIYREELGRIHALETILLQLNEKQLTTIDARQKYFAYIKDNASVISEWEEWDEWDCFRDDCKKTAGLLYNYDLGDSFITQLDDEKILYEFYDVSTSIENCITEEPRVENRRRVKSARIYSILRFVIVFAVILGFNMVSKAMFKVDIGSDDMNNDNGIIYSDDIDNTEDQVESEEPHDQEVQLDIEDEYFSPGATYYTQAVLKVREGPGKNYRQLSRDELAAEDYTYSEDYPEACLKEGSPVICLEMTGEWMRISSGWICTFDEGEELVK